LTAIALRNEDFMKQFFLTSVLALSFLFPASVMAESSKNEESVQISSEISTLLLNEDFAQVLAQAKTDAAKNGKVLRITSIEKFPLGASQWIEVVLQERSSVNFKWKSGGSIMASCYKGPMGLVGFDGIYFKPAAGHPGGGASVGNN